MDSGMLQMLALHRPHSTSITVILPFGRMQEQGVKDILAVDVCPTMVEALQHRFGAASTLGNDACVRTWLGDVTELPAYQASRGSRGLQALK
jgi:hypothetical protein